LSRCGKFDGKLWIDITNPFNTADDFILPWNTSGAEEIRALSADTHCRCAFKECLVGGV
jgi:hypothetical protein